MVYTVTFNPAIDYVVHADELKPGAVNRSRGEEIYFGGKGINVSFVLKELGVPSVALGFIAGFTGDAIEKGLTDMGLPHDFIRLENGFSRINVKVKASEETELNGTGPVIDDASLSKLFSKLDELAEGDILVLSGSIPPSLPADTYERILKRLSGKGIKAVVDAEKDLLLNVLKYRPFLIKPNLFELGEMFGGNPSSDDEIKECALRLKEMGAANVLVSMGPDGALLLNEDGIFHRSYACRGEVKNSVGAGDSMTAGFIAGSLTGGGEYALMLGTAAGCATAFSYGLAKRDLIYELLDTLRKG